MSDEVKRYGEDGSSETDGCFVKFSDYTKLEARCKELEQELLARPPKPLTGEARSRLLTAMECGSVDEAIAKYTKLKDERDELDWILEGLRK